MIVPTAFENQRLLKRLQDDPQVYAQIRALFVQRRDMRREQAEAASGETALKLLAAARELTSILNELLPEDLHATQQPPDRRADVPPDRAAQGRLR